MRPATALFAAAFAAAVVVVVPPAARAQVPDSSRPDYLTLNLGTGPVFPISDADGRFQTGFGFPVGLAYNFNRFLSVHLEYFYSRYSVEAGALGATSLDANHGLQCGNLNALVTVYRGRPVSAYVLGGPGVYFRRVEITRFEGVGVTTFCDPWLMFCYPAAVPIEAVLGSRSETDFGVNAGAGVSLELAEDLSVYVETRYHHVFGRTVQTPAGPRDADGQYLPVQVGLRFGLLPRLLPVP